MSSMYKIPPLMPDDFDVEPIDIMYSIPTYHGSQSSMKESDVGCNGLPDDLNAPVKAIERKQQSLLKSIKDLGSTLDALLHEMRKCGASLSAPEKNTPDEFAASVSESSVKAGGKKDKDAKKEARKAAKAEAKSKVVSSSGTDKTLEPESGYQWVIHEEKRSTETGQSLTACLPPGLTDFEKKKLGELTLYATEADKPWIEVLAHVGDKRNVAFKGEVSNICSNASTSVVVSFGEKFSAATSERTLTCRVSTWKFLGSALGLFSFKSNHSVHSIHQHRWLSKVDLVMSGKLSRDDIIREASKFLSQFDALGSQFDFGIADLVAKSVLIGTSSAILPNNVELWSRRMDSVI
ncbi:hypothetical protein RB195_002330 [Necator americanus]|uniref:Uncharacterized protein n=1 Tax=Necator americanus TaxID=51031 RepID=A0ABR1DJJ2_NECAM